MRERSPPPKAERIEELEQFVDDMIGAAETLRLLADGGRADLAALVKAYAKQIEDRARVVARGCG